VASFGILSTVPWVAPLGLYLATMRYLGDVRSGLGLLGALGLWALWGRAARPWQRRCAVGLSAGLTLTTIALGLLLGFQGYTGHFERFNPELSARLERSLSLCD
jgi:4-amino-4-deoxy-L-arabinose transferase-like glycosyltransferase